MQALDFTASNTILATTLYNLKFFCTYVTQYKKSERHVASFAEFIKRASILVIEWFKCSRSLHKYGARFSAFLVFPTNNMKVMLSTPITIHSILNFNIAILNFHIAYFRASGFALRVEAARASAGNRRAQQDV